MQKKALSAPRLTMRGNIENVTRGTRYQKFFDFVYTSGGLQVTPGFDCANLPPQRQPLRLRRFLRRA